MSSLKKHFANFGSHHGNPHQECGKSGHESAVSQCGDKIQPQISFKADVLNCLDQCTAYIQALNNLCSVGSIFAASLTQFSRDVSATSLLPQQAPAAKSESRRRLLRLKPGVVPHHSHVPADPDHGHDSDSDCLYSEMTEQFLRTWEMMSVSTAGASATIKTDTLMTLQEVVNQLESDDAVGDASPDQSPDLGKSIQSAKSCLLAYIELQAQFSYNSWKSLNHLSKALKSDAHMADVVKNIKQHFDLNKSVVPESVASSRPDEKSQDRSVDPGIKTRCTAPCVSGLKEAMDLLSLDEDSRSGKRRRRIKCRKKDRKDGKVRDVAANKSERRENQPNRQTMPAPVRLSQLGDKCFSSSQMESSVLFHEADAKSQSTSTWPGKGVASHAVTAADAHEDGNRVQDSWSLWSSASPSFGHSQAGSAWRDTTQHTSWNVFPAESSQSLSRSNLRSATAALSASTLSGSGASSSASIGVPSSTSSSVATNRNYDLFSPTQKNPVSYYGTNSLKVLGSISNNNNNDLNFTGFASRSDGLRADRTLSPTCSLTTKSSLNFNPQTLSGFGPGVRSPLMSTDYDALLIAPTNGCSLLPDSTRFKTCTWPLKQESLSTTGPTVSNNCPTSGLTNSNWTGLSSAVSSFPADNMRPFDNDPIERQLTSQSLWSFDAPDKGNTVHRHVHPQLSIQSSLPIVKDDSTRYTLFETNNNGGLSDKNF